MKTLVIDIGGSKLKILATGETEPRKAPSGPELTPARMVQTVRDLAEGWEFDGVSIGVPCPVGDDGPRSEPGNLGPGWVGFNFAAAFERPVKVVNDAVMQALGSYQGSRMLFLGLGTGLGGALIAERVLVSLELGRLPFRSAAGRTLGDTLGRAGRKKLGKSTWRRAVYRIGTHLIDAFLADDLVIGGGDAKKLKRLPPGSRIGHNLTAFRGGFRLWGVGDVPILSAEDHHHQHSEAGSTTGEWRLI